MFGRAGHSEFLIEELSEYDDWNSVTVAIKMQLAVSQKRYHKKCFCLQSKDHDEDRMGSSRTVRLCYERSVTVSSNWKRGESLEKIFDGANSD